MPKTNIPSCRLHKASGQAFIEPGERRFCLGKYGSKPSEDEYERRFVAVGRRAGKETDRLPVLLASLTEEHFNFITNFVR